MTPRGEQKMVPRAEPRSYYGRPVIKPPVWTYEVPWYLFAGGLTGASATLSLAAAASGNTVLARRAWLVTLAGGTASPALLISDLGRPERFLNMLRVLKPTSPMSVGSWVLAATGAAAGVATLADVLGRFARAGRAGRVAAALLGLPLATYTGALLSNTAVPVWHEARRELPFVFAGSAAASAGGAAAILTPARHAGPARRLAVLGAALETAAVGVMERRLGALAGPYRSGKAARYGRAARALTIAGAAVLATAGRRRTAAIAGGKLVLAGSALERWSVFAAGFDSARDPSYTVGPQRERL
jgi:formate-dependent nitrite reductase membrane component NrfD